MDSQRLVEETMKFQRLETQSNTIFRDIANAKSDAERAKQINAYNPIVIKSIAELISVTNRYIPKEEIKATLIKLEACLSERNYQRYINPSRELVA